MAVRKPENHRSERRRGSSVYTQRFTPSPSQDQMMNGDDGRRLLDEKSRAYFNVSGDEFAELYRAGVYNLDHPKVAKLGMLVAILDGD
ncbi:MAG: hypothetical protein QM753_13465 [Thermomicrobiales bacterium]